MQSHWWGCCLLFALRAQEHSGSVAGKYLRKDASDLQISNLLFLVAQTQMMADSNGLFEGVKGSRRSSSGSLGWLWLLWTSLSEGTGHCYMPSWIGRETWWQSHAESAKARDIAIEVPTLARCEGTQEAQSQYVSA